MPVISLQIDPSFLQIETNYNPCLFRIENPNKSSSILIYHLLVIKCRLSKIYGTFRIKICPFLINPVFLQKKNHLSLKICLLSTCKS